MRYKKIDPLATIRYCVVKRPGDTTLYGTKRMAGSSCRIIAYLKALRPFRGQRLISPGHLDFDDN